MNRRIFFIPVSLSMIFIVLVLYIFNVYAYQISNFNAAFRTFVVHQKLSLRVFDDGIPVSYSASSEKFVSPFYVVHYGLIYSNNLMNDGGHWAEDATTKYWNVAPPKEMMKNKEHYFKDSVDWLLENIEEYKGRSHFLYNFDWPYRSHVNGGLKAPWWSGLTDGYAIILMLRAYDYFGDIRYLRMADSLYESVLTPISKGGSLNQHNGCPWVEEYVDPRIEPEMLSYVLNGAVYGAHGVREYEEYKNYSASSRRSGLLYECIASNIEIFDRNGWSDYDALGNSANIKYHRINYYLIKDLFDEGTIEAEDNASEEVLASWRLGVDNPGLYYLLKGPRSVAYYHFVVFLIICLLLPLATMLVLCKFLSRNES